MSGLCLTNFTMIDDAAAPPLYVQDGRIVDVPQEISVDLGGRLITPGLLDVQVNGGGGLMLAECATTDDLARIATAQMAAGTTYILPTLISDTIATTARIINLIADAQAKGLWQIAGLHLEGPHLALAGAHDPAMLRPMTAEDLALYLETCARLGTLMLTLAPEEVTPAQIRTLTEGGVIVSLGHTACDYDTACATFAAGARGVTHLFNAMSGLHHRAPGLVGAALESDVFLGLIADRKHVHPAVLRMVQQLAADRIVLVSDAMAVAGTDLPGFRLSGRKIARVADRLTLSDGTLAGADLTLAQAIAWLALDCGASNTDILQTALQTPWALLDRPSPNLDPGSPAVFVVWNDRDAPPFVHTPDGWWQGQAPS